ncbi:hypothetical protein COW46_02005 [Candidatus Gracilibacteria bacterium CG17_big_fil_post_rev_8_21_14_2_50_48_13]|nr:MAG: hypothetical protein COW46_02005 [Candidatus Gracilibacteria bacterium CG17_big_fil_post_rev_8_21_14_2_50_48_13]
MKMQGQHQEKQQSILGKNFSARQRVSFAEHCKSFWEKHMSAFHGDRLLLASGAWFLVATSAFVLGQLAYNPGFVTIAGIQNPISRVAPYLKTQKTLESLSTEYIARQKMITERIVALNALQDRGENPTNPLLSALNSIKEARPAWQNVLRDLDSATKKTVESNDILRRISLGTVQMISETKQSTITGARTLTDNARSSTSIAADFLKNLEASPSIKNVQSSDPVTKEETASGSILSYTPLDITFMYAEPEEASIIAPTSQVQQLLDSAPTK